MKIKVVISLILLCCSFGLFAKAQNANTFEAETKVRLEYIEKQADKNEAKLNDEIKALNEKLTQQSKQIQQEKSELNDKMAELKASDRVVSWGGWIIGLLSIIIGVGGVVAPILMYRRNEKLRNDVKREKESWEKERTDLTQEHKSSIQTLKLEIENLKTSFTKKMLEFDSRFEGFLSNASERVLLERDTINLNETAKEPDEQEAKQIKEDIEKLTKQARKNNSFETFYKSSQLSYYLKEYDLAFNNINKAIELQESDLDKAKGLTIKAGCLYFLDKKPESVEVQNQIINLYHQYDLNIQEQVAQAYFNKGITLGEIDESEQEMTAYDELIKRFKDSQEVVIQEQVAKAYVNKGIRLGERGEPEQVIATCDELIKQFKDSQEIAIQERVAKAYFNKGVGLGKINESEKAIATYDELIKRFNANDEVAVQEMIVKAYFNKGITLGQLDEPEQEIATYEELIKRFKDIDELAIQEKVATAYVNKGITLGQLDEPEQEIATYEELIERFKDSDELAIQEKVATAYVNKAATFELLENYEKGIATCNAMIDKFSSNREPDIMELVEKCKELKKRFEDLASGGDA